MKIKVFFSIVVVLSFVFSCTQPATEAQDPGVLTIDLQKHSEQGPFTSMLWHLRMVDSIPKGLKGIPDLDSVSVQHFRATNSKRLADLLQKKVIDSQTLATLNYKMYAVSAIDKNEQIFILDMNRNMDFSDDTVHRLDISIRDKTEKDQKLRDSFPQYTIPFNNFVDGKVSKQDLRVRFVPIKDFVGFLEPTPEKNLYTKLLVAAYKTQHWTGDIDIKDKDSVLYKVAMVDHWNSYQYIFREKDKPFYSRRNRDDEYEEFTIGDTIQLGNTIIKIDSVREDLNQLYLTKLDIAELPHGYKKGHTIRNYAFTDFYGEQKTIHGLLRGKQYLLIDFWGTWCVPCLKLTPDLKQLQEEHPEVAILGVDFDTEKAPGLDYVKEKQMDWTHWYVPKIRKDSVLHKKIVSKLKIDRYPTFLLIDKQYNIVYRGIAKTGLENIKEILSKTHNSTLTQ